MDPSTWNRRTVLIVVIVVVILVIFIVLGLLIVSPVSAPASVCTLYRAQISKDMQDIHLLHKQGQSPQRTAELARLQADLNRLQQRAKDSQC